MRCDNAIAVASYGDKPKQEAEKLPAQRGTRFASRTDNASVSDQVGISEECFMDRSVTVYRTDAVVQGPRWIDFPVRGQTVPRCIGLSCSSAMRAKANLASFQGYLSAT